MQVALTDTVVAESYDPFAQGVQSYLMSMDVEVGFAGKKSTDVPYDQDELAQAFINTFRHQIFAPGQQLLMDFRSIPLRLTVRTVALGDLSRQESQPVSSPQARGVLIPETALNYFKDAK